MTIDTRDESDSWASPLKNAILLVLLPLIIGAWFVMMFVLFAVMIPCFIAFSRIFRPSTHEARMEAMWDLDGNFERNCPDCNTKMTVSDVRKTTGNGDVTFFHQSAFCLKCDRSFRRSGFGKIWQGWESATPQLPQ